jgi:hypothetical protein
MPRWTELDTGCVSDDARAAASLRAAAAEARDLAACMSLRVDRERLLDEARRMEDTAQRLEQLAPEEGRALPRSPIGEATRRDVVQSRPV